MAPVVSVIMPVFNADKYLVEALESVLGQDLRDIEIIVVDDCSSDSSSEIIDGFKSRDGRVISIRNNRNMGIVYSLNLAISLAKAPIIARMDADDISSKDRLSVQLAKMMDEESLIVVGSNIRLIDNEGKIIGAREYPESWHDILDVLPHCSPFCHPSVMFSKQAVERVGGYREEYQVCQDYDLWLRMSKIGRMGNIQKDLLKYRIHAGQITINKLELQHKLHIKARREALGLGDYSIKEKLKGSKGTLGRKYISVAHQQYLLGNNKLAKQFVLRAFKSSPFCKELWSCMAMGLRRTRIYSIALWYWRRMSSCGG